MSSMDSLEILKPNALIAFLSSLASIDLKLNNLNDKYIDLGQPKSVAPGWGCSEPD